MKRSVILILILILPSSLSAGWLDKLFGYDSYEACILDKMEGVTSKIAAYSIRSACRKTTSEPEIKDDCNKEITPAKGSETEASLTLGMFFNVNFYNASKDLTVTKMEVTLNGKRDGVDFTRDLYLTGSPITPLDTTEFSGRLGFGLDVIDDWSWTMNKVYGCKK